MLNDGVRMNRTDWRSLLLFTLILCPRPHQQLIPNDRNDGVSLLTKFILCVLQQISRLNIQLNDIQLE